MVSEFKKYRRKHIAELRPYVPGESMNGISISAPDKDAGSPKLGDMIARNPKNHKDQWLVAEQYFKDNFEPIEAATALEALERNAALERDLFKELYAKECHARLVERDWLAERVAELEKALEPFAREAEEWSPEANGGLVFEDAESIAGETSITVGHLRTARSLVKGGGDE